MGNAEGTGIGEGELWVFCSVYPSANGLLCFLSVPHVVALVESAHNSVCVTQRNKTHSKIEKPGGKRGGEGGVQPAPEQHGSACGAFVSPFSCFFVPFFLFFFFSFFLFFSGLRQQLVPLPAVEGVVHAVGAVDARGVEVRPVFTVV